MKEQISYRKGYKYQLAEEYTLQTDILPTYDIITNFIELTMEGGLTIRRGYAWDGASGPFVDTNKTRRPSLIHDAFYQLMRYSLLPQEAREAVDLLLYTTCREDLVTWLVAKGIYLAVRQKGAKYAHPSHIKEVCVSP